MEGKLSKKFIKVMLFELFNWDICVLYYARRAFLLFKGGKFEGKGVFDDIVDCVRGVIVLLMMG